MGNAISLTPLFYCPARRLCQSRLMPQKVSSPLVAKSYSEREYWLEVLSQLGKNL